MPLTEFSEDVLRYILSEIEEAEAFEAELAVNTSWSLPIADAGTGWDEGATRRALDAWAGNDLAKYGQAFLWKGPDKSSMKFPIATVMNGKLTIVPRAVSAALGRLNQGNLPDAVKAQMRQILMGIQKRYSSTNTSSMQAAGGPVTPPAAWFAHQDIKGDPGLTVTPEGQVYGYLALWRSCHMSVGRGRCVKAPRTKTNYQYFHLGSTEVGEDGEQVKVGRLTVGGGHADPSLGIIPATEHYDNAGSTVAVVRAFEDDLGIQVAGAVVPGAMADQVAALRRSPLSGDWRGVNGNLELVAALAVNTPGFPVFAEDEEGHELSLISAGVPGDHGHDDEDPTEVLGVDTDEVVAKVITALDDRDKSSRRAATLADHEQFQARQEQDRRAEILRSMKGAK